MSFILAHSGQMMSSPSVMKPRPTSEVLQPAQMKQSLCQCLSSNEMKRVPPMPENQSRLNQMNLCLFEPLSAIGFPKDSRKFQGPQDCIDQKSAFRMDSLLDSLIEGID